MIVTILYRMEGEPETTANAKFKDVKPESWYASAVAWAAEKEIVSGYGDNTFKPDNAITREQFATILYRYANFKKMDTTKSADLKSYKDEGKISSWAKKAMSWAVAEGYITGKTTDTLDPQGKATRAEAAAIFVRFSENGESK